jgi:Squalene-hopene cyclase C-terminal domain
MSHVRRAVACCGALTVALLSFSVSARAADPVAVADAVAYLSSSPPQIAGTTPATGSGAWDDAPDFQFVTTEAVLAIAEAAQTGPSWSTSEALAAVEHTENPQGQNPLAFLDLVSAGSTTPGRAAKFLVLVAAPLGLDTSALATTIGDPAPDGSFAGDLYFTDTLFAALAKDLLGGSAPPATVAYIESKQQAAGSWAYNADTTPSTDPDIDTTGLAVQALIAGGVPQSDPAVQHALAWLASQQNADGTWSFFGDPSAESTSRAVLAITAAGYDPNSRCWRDSVLPSAAGRPFVGADAALEAMAQPDGSISGPNVFSAAYATGQAVQGLERSWLPVARAADAACVAVSPAPPVTPTPAAVAVPVVPRFTG